jgi:hypothetical protein
LCKSLEITNTLADVILFTSPADMSCSTTKRLPHNTSSILALSSARSRAPRARTTSSSSLPQRECRRGGPADFLHDLFQAISPLVEDDEKLSAALRHKAAKALLGSANSHVPRACRDLHSSGPGGEQTELADLERQVHEVDEEGDTLWYVAASAISDGNAPGLYDDDDADGDHAAVGYAFESLLHDAGFYDAVEANEGVSMTDMSLQHPEWFAMVESGM